MLHAEAVLFVLLVVEGLQLVNGQLVELVEVVPPLVAAAQLRAQVGVGYLAAHLGRHVKRAHRQHVHAVAGYRAQRRRHALHHARMDVRALAGRNVYAHAGAAEGQTALVFALGYLCAHAQAHAVEHVFGIVVVGRLDAHVLYLPALGLEVRHYRLLERIARKVRAYDQLLVLNGLHIQLPPSSICCIIASTNMPCASGVGWFMSLHSIAVVSTPFLSMLHHTRYASATGTPLRAATSRAVCT